MRHCIGIFVYSTSLVLGGILVLQAWTNGRPIELNESVPMTIIGAALILFSERMAAVKTPVVLALILLVMGVFAFVLLGIPLVLIFLATIGGGAFDAAYIRSMLLLGVIIAAYALAARWSTRRLQRR